MRLKNDNQNATNGEVRAAKVFERGLKSAVLVDDYVGGMYGKEVGITEWTLALVGSVKALKSNDLSSMEAILTGQTLALDAIFTNLARKANLNNRMDQLDLCMRQALKAQNQSRATLEALAAIKSPQKTVSYEAGEHLEWAAAGE